MEQFTEIIRNILLQIPDGIAQVWIWGVLPCLPLLYTIAGFFMLLAKGDLSVAEEIRIWKRSSKAEYLQHSFRMFRSVIVQVTLISFVCALLLMPNLRNEDFASRLSDQAGTVCSIIIGLTTIVITVSVVIVLFNKDYYLVFTITEVLQAYHFMDCLGYIMCSCLTTCISTVILLNQPAGTFWSRAALLILEGSILYNFAATSYSFWVIFKIMFSNQKIELRLLEQLHEIFLTGSDSDSTRIKDAGEWDLGAIRTNVEYLSAKYIMAARKLPIHEAGHFHPLASSKSRQEAWEYWSAGLRRKYIIFDIAAYLISLAVNVFTLKEHSLGMVLLDTVIFLGSSLPIFLLLKSVSIRERLSALFSDILGYTLDMAYKDKIVIPRFALGLPDRYEKFVMQMNNLTAFFYIALQHGAKQDTMEEALDIALDWFRDVQNSSGIFYLPLFTIGYFTFEKEQKLPALRRLFHELEMSREEQREFCSMLAGQLSCLSRTASQADSDFEDSVKRYLYWLCMPPGTARLTVH